MFHTGQAELISVWLVGPDHSERFFLIFMKIKMTITKKINNITDKTAIIICIYISLEGSGAFVVTNSGDPGLALSAIELFEDLPEKNNIFKFTANGISQAKKKKSLQKHSSIHP